MLDFTNCWSAFVSLRWLRRFWRNKTPEGKDNRLTEGEEERRKGEKMVGGLKKTEERQTAAIASRDPKKGQRHYSLRRHNCASALDGTSNCVPSPISPHIEEATKGSGSKRKDDPPNASPTSAEGRLRPSSQSARPCSSLVDGFCPGRPFARIRLFVQYSQQKKLLIITLNELAQNVDDDLWSMDCSKESLQVRLALLSDCPTPKVQKFRSAFVPSDPFPLLAVQFGQTFAFDVPPGQLAESVVRLKLYRKSRQKRADCAGIAFLRNYLVDVEAKKAQNHFLQFCRILEPMGGPAKGSLSLFPSLLSLHPHHHHNQLQPQSSKCSPSPSPDLRLPPHCSPSPSTYQRTSLGPSFISPLYPSAIYNDGSSPTPSRRSSTVDESGRFCSLPHADGQKPEVLVSLCFFEDQNRLAIGVDKVALRGQAQRENGPETEVFVRITSISLQGTETEKHKSASVKMAPEMTLNTQTVFSLCQPAIDTTQILVQLFASQHGVFLRRKLRLIGSLALGGGRCSSSSDAREHWRQMLQGKGTTVDKWHILETEPSGK
uniref:C2 domain-containing protein n=1 Tax=Globodera rostochiensis TaxID=31243 RepID=A0A914HHN2_GLORO